MSDFQFRAMMAMHWITLTWIASNGRNMAAVALFSIMAGYWSITALRAAK